MNELYRKWCWMKTLMDYLCDLNDLLCILTMLRQLQRLFSEGI
jgi:hypothetical protein